MKKSSYFFDHDYNARNDEKVLQLRSEFGAEGYGVYWMILESMAESSDGAIHRVAIGGLSLSYGIPKEKLTAIIDYTIGVGLLKESVPGDIVSSRMIAHKARIEAMRKAGKRGAEKRWSTSHEDSHPITPPLVPQCKGEERRVDKISNVPSDVWHLFDEYERISGRKIMARTGKRISALSARLKEFEQQDIIRAWAAMSTNKHLRGENTGKVDYFSIEYASRPDRIEHWLNHYHSQTDAAPQ